RNIPLFRMAYVPKLYLSSRISSSASRNSVRMVGGLGDPGAGAGRSGGSGGSIRDAGGAFGKMEAAREYEYFYNLEKFQLKTLKDKLKRNIEQHQMQMKNHQEVLERHQKKMAALEKAESTIS
ncbi:hypothetical protein PENTCL1PPCAC_1694, partial [Pristionchus entomophagus]